MKRLISITLLLALCLTLASCGGKKGDPVTGIYSDGDYTYVLYDAEGGWALLFHGDEYEGGNFNTPSMAKYSVDGDSITIGGDTHALSDLTKLDKVEFPTNLNNSVSEAVVHLVPPVLTSLRDGYLLDGSTRALLITSGDEVILDNGCLKNTAGEDGLAVIIAPDCDPNKITVAKNMLDGADNVTFYIPKESLSTFKSHYNWANFKDLMVGY